MSITIRPIQAALTRNTSIITKMVEFILFRILLSNFILEDNVKRLKFAKMEANILHGAQLLPSLTQETGI